MQYLRRQQINRSTDGVYVYRPTAASGSGLQPPQANGGCSEVKGQHCATSGASSPHAGTPAAAAFRAAMKRAAAEPADDRFAGHGGGGKRRSVADAASDADITPQHLIDTQLEALLGAAAKGGPSRSGTKARLKALQSLLAAVAPHEVAPADCPQAVVRDPATVLAWHAPTAVVLCGSFVQGTTVSAGAVPGQAPGVDVAVQMPRACFLAKDHLNHKYSDKRALYLGVMLRVLRDSPMFADAKLGRLSPAGTACSRPIIVVPAAAGSPRLRIIPHVGEDGLVRAKLLPSRNNNRRAAAEAEATVPTPLYNNAVLEDILMLSVANDAAAAVSSNPHLAKAMVLMKVWLMQRHLHLAPGGVSADQLCLVLCYLQSTATINSEMTPWQMIRATLLYLSHARGKELESAAAHPLRVAGAVIGGSAPKDNMAMYLSAFDVVLLDSSGQLNVLASVSATGFAELVWHARMSMTVAATAEPHELLSALFLDQLKPACMFDVRAVVTLQRPTTLPTELEEGLHESSWQELVQRHAEAVVIRALGDRAALVRTLSADLVDTTVGGTTALRWVVGCKINSDKAERTVDKGPPVENREAAADFKQFWGSKSEVRRMKDGAIVQAVIWSSCTGLAKRHHVIDCILSHILKYQLQNIAHPELRIEVADGQPMDKIIFRKHHSETQWKPAYDAFERLAKKIRNCRGDGTEGLPLAIVRVVATSARLRRCSSLPPRPHTLIPGCTLPRDEAEPSLVVRPMGVIIEFEGSGTWPADDMMALRAIKTAMLLRLAETLKEKFNVTTQATRSHLDVFVDGYAFRVVISHGREMSLIQEDITILERAEAANEAQKPYLLARVPRGLTPAVLPVLRKELAMIRSTIHFAPLHASSVNAMMLKYSAVARSVRLAKSWCHAHMFSGYMSPELIELLVVYCFTPRGAAPHGVPATHIQGFGRFLLLLTQYDWEGAPLVINLDDAAPIDDAAIEEAWSKRDETANAMYVVTDYDLSSTWTRDGPTTQVLNKVKSFARASTAALFSYLEGNGKPSSLKALFQTPLNRFDVLIHLRAEVLPSSVDALNQSYKKSAGVIAAGPLALPAPRAKNLQFADSFEDQLLSGFAPPTQYVEELREHFGSTAMVFYDDLGGKVVGVSWLPLACVPQRGRSGLKLQMLSDSMLVPSSGTDGSDESHPTLLIRNMFECVSSQHTPSLPPPVCCVMALH